MVIEIPEELKSEIDCADDETYRSTISWYDTTLYYAIKNGTPLPKGHGDMKDIGKCNRKLFYQQCGGANSFITVKTAFDMLLSLPTIIKADIAESEDKE